MLGMLTWASERRVSILALTLFKAPLWMERFHPNWSTAKVNQITRRRHFWNFCRYSSALASFVTLQTQNGRLTCSIEGTGL